MSVIVERPLEAFLDVREVLGNCSSFSNQLLEAGTDHLAGYVKLNQVGWESWNKQALGGMHTLE
jgi:hypothetical protein